MSTSHIDSVRQSFQRDGTYGRNGNTNGKDSNRFGGLDTAEGDERTDSMVGQTELKRDGLTAMHMAAYAVGHVYNDFCATCWFMYLLYFLTYPVGLGAGKASIALLAGQIADGVATNVVGVLIDKTNTRIGKKKPWYIIGFILVIPSFILTFNTCAL